MKKIFLIGLVLMSFASYSQTQKSEFADYKVCSECMEQWKEGDPAINSGFPQARSQSNETGIVKQEGEQFKRILITTIAGVLTTIALVKMNSISTLTD